MKQTKERPGWNLSWIVLAVVVVAASGCGGGRLTKVRGVVTLDGKPLDRAGVAFEPIGGHGQPARGITASDGSFYLDTHAPDDGAWPGEYKVVISKYEVDPAMLQRVDPSDPKANEKMYAADAKARAKPRRHLVPAIYRDAEKTPLRWKIPDDNNKTLELTSTAK
jgi:hypothetical protein